MGCFQKSIGKGVRSCTRTRTKEAQTERRGKTTDHRSHKTALGCFPCCGRENGEASVALTSSVADGPEHNGTQRRLKRTGAQASFRVVVIRHNSLPDRVNYAASIKCAELFVLTVGGMSAFWLLLSLPALPLAHNSNLQRGFIYRRPALRIFNGRSWPKRSRVWVS
jgi:hypothetical protein